MDAKVRADCLIALKKEFGADISDQDLSDILNSVADQLGDELEAGEALNVATKQIIENVREGLSKKRLDALLDAEKFVEKVKYINQPNLRNNPDEAIRSILLGEGDPGTVGSGRGINTDAAAMENTNMNIFFMDLDAFSGELRGRPDVKSKELSKIYASGKLEKEIYMDYITPGSSGVKEAELIAKALRRLNNRLHEDLNLSGAQVKYRKDRPVKQTHDPEKIGHTDAEFAIWHKALTTRHKVDWKETFGTTNPKTITARLRKVFDNISEEMSELDLDSITLGDVNPMGISRQDVSGGLRKSRTLVFADGESAYNYNVEFGKGDLRTNVDASVRSQTRAAATIRHLGTRPKEMLKKLETVASKLSREAPKKTRDSFIEGARGGTYDTLLDQAMGTDYVPANSIVVKVARAVRALLNATLLGNATIASVTEQGMSTAAIRSVTGDDFFTANFKQVGAWLQSVSPAERQRFAAEAGLILEHSIGSVLARMGMDAPGELPKSAERFFNKFFRLNLLSQQTAISREAVAIVIMRDLGSKSHLDFSGLNAIQRGKLESYGITSVDWNVMRNSPKADIKGVQGIVRSGIRNASDSDVNAGIRETFKRTGRRMTQQEYIRDLELKYSGLINDTANAGSGTPGARQRAFTREYGFKPGTLQGELSTAFWQFSSYPLTVQRMIRRMTLLDPDASGKTTLERLSDLPTLVAAGGLMAHLTALGYVRLALNDISNGTTPRDPMLNPGATFRDAFVAGGAAGLYTGVLFSRYSEHAGLLGSMAGPGFSKLDDVKGIWHSALNGDPKGIAKKSMNFGSGFIPNLFYTRMALNHAILWNMQEMVNPGFAKRTRDRAQEQGRDFFIRDPVEATR